MNSSSRAAKNPLLKQRVCVVILATLLTGCGKDEIRVYRVPKEKADAAAVANEDVDSGQAQLSWTLPPGWQEQPPAKMRVASFVFPGKSGQQLDVSIIPLPGVTGRDLEVVNLWRDQLRLVPVADEEMAKQTQAVEIGPIQGKLFDMTSTEPLIDEKFRARILVAIVTRGDASWFFKMTGEDSLVNEQRPAFLQFLKSIKFHADRPPTGLADARRRPVSTNVKQVPHAADNSAKPIWAVPSGWQELPPSQMLLAKFLVPGTGGAKAEVNVSVLSAAGGGVLANVNRWRNQLSLPPLDEAGVDKLVTPLDAAGGKAMLVDMTGTDAKTGQKARMIGAIMPQTEQTWFYKMMGDEQIVEREKEAFTKFVQTIKYPNGL